jgi:hypothetical protein
VFGEVNAISRLVRTSAYFDPPKSANRRTKNRNRGFARPIRSTEEKRNHVDDRTQRDYALGLRRDDQLDEPVVERTNFDVAHRDTNRSMVGFQLGSFAANRGLSARDVSLYTRRR